MVVPMRMFCAVAVAMEMSVAGRNGNAPSERHIETVPSGRISVMGPELVMLPCIMECRTMIRLLGCVRDRSTVMTAVALAIGRASGSAEFADRADCDPSAEPY